MRRSIDGAIFLAGLTAILYTWSTAAYNGYLDVAKLDADMMERSFHQVIYGGLLVSFGPILLLAILSAIALYVYSHALLPSYIDWIRGSVKIKRKVVKVRRFWVGKRNSPPVELRAKSIFSKAALLTLFGVAYICSLVYFERNGSQKAKDDIETHIKHENKPVQMIKVELNQKMRILKLLKCGARNCAGIEEDTNEIYYFPSFNSFSYKIENVMPGSN